MEARSKIEFIEVYFEAAMLPWHDLGGDRAMEYKLDCFDANGHIERRIDIFAESDSEALEGARRLQHPRAIDVWCLGRKIDRISAMPVKSDATTQR